jgi:hypothetical protein
MTVRRREIRGELLVADGARATGTAVSRRHRLDDSRRRYGDSRGLWRWRVEFHVANAAPATPDAR